MNRQFNAIKKKKEASMQDILWFQDMPRYLFIFIRLTNIVEMTNL